MAEELAVFGEGSLTFREFARKEPLPLATWDELAAQEIQPPDEDAEFQ
jgi:hypothetical protein